MVNKMHTGFSLETMIRIWFVDLHLWFVITTRNTGTLGFDHFNFILEFKVNGR